MDIEMSSARIWEFAFIDKAEYNDGNSARNTADESPCDKQSSEYLRERKQCRTFHLKLDNNTN